MQAQRSIRTRPRRVAAAVALSRIKNIARSQRRGPQPEITEAEPDLDEVTGCPLCFKVIKHDEELERCQACLTWVHHACVQPVVEAFDWECRGLCGFPNVHLARQQCPLPRCGQSFRLSQQDNEARWMALFGTRMWRRYARKPHVALVLTWPPLAKLSPWYLDRLRPRARWWLARNATVSNDPERRVMPPNSANVAWNQPNQPKRLLDQPHAMYRGWTNPASQFALRWYFRHQKYFIHPRLPYAEDHQYQRYIFSDLNVLIHGGGRMWNKICKYYDDHGITIADMQNL